MVTRGRGEARDEGMATLHVQKLLNDWEHTQLPRKKQPFPLHATDISLNSEKSQGLTKPYFPQIAASTFPSSKVAWEPVSLPLSSRVLCDPQQQLSPPVGLLQPAPFRSIDEWHRSCGPQRRREGVKALRGVIWRELIEKLGDLLLKNTYSGLLLFPLSVTCIRPGHTVVAKQRAAHRASELHRTPISVTKGLIPTKPAQNAALSTTPVVLHTEATIDSRSASPLFMFGGRETSLGLGNNSKIFRTGSASRRRYDRQPNNPYMELSSVKFPILSGLLAETNCRIGRGRQRQGQFRASVCANPRQIKRALQPSPAPLSTRTQHRIPKSIYPIH